MGLKATLKHATSRFSRTRLVRSVDANLIYPTIVRCLKAETQPDQVRLAPTTRRAGGPPPA
jgi:hypothetical protein